MPESIKSIELRKGIVLYEGDVFDVLKIIPNESVDCCITSPPYWGLRDYETAKWEGGDPNCDHRGKPMATKAGFNERYFGRPPKRTNKQGECFEFFKDICLKCGAKRVDKQIGLEKTPEKYVNKLVNVFREVRRILKREGTLWLNLGDSYASKGKEGGDIDKDEGIDFNRGRGRLNNHKIIKPKDLIGIPWTVAFALRADGWYLRQDIIWAKPNPIPESVKDRCTKSHEYIFLLAKSRKYYFDNEAIREKYEKPMNRWGGQILKANGESDWDKETGQKTYRYRDMRPNSNGRNKRSVWVIATKPYKEAHFATFPPDLVIPMVKAGCPEGGIVLDCFAGSGTTLEVAYKLKRKAIGIELNPRYCELVKKRFDSIPEILI